MNTELISPQLEEFGKGQKRHHVSEHLSESFPLAFILAEQCVHHQEERSVTMIGQRQPGKQSHPQD